MYLLQRKSISNFKREINSDTFAEEYYIEMSKVGFLSKKGKGLLANIYWKIITSLCFIIEVKERSSKKTVHYSYLMRSKLKFPFMKKNEIMIGPSVTRDEFKGHNIFTNVLKNSGAIVKNHFHGFDYIIALVRVNNQPSNRSFEKAGFFIDDDHYDKNFFKIYHRVSKK